MVRSCREWTNAQQIFARHSSEYIQFDEPDTVISGIREVYEWFCTVTGRIVNTISGGL